MKKIYFGNLDAIRSIACLMVLIAHILSEYLAIYFTSSVFFLNPIALFFLKNGRLGVQIFFTLSGFLITYLIIREIEDTGRLNIINFYIRRILRIWPVYFTVLIFVYIIYAWVKVLLKIDTVIYESPLMSGFFLSNYDLIRIKSIKDLYDNGMISITWSVSVEEQFYLFWPLFFVMLATKYFKWVILTAIIAAVAFSISNCNDLNLLYHHTISNLLFLGTGGFLGYLVAYEHTSLKIFDKLTKLQWSIIFISFLILLIFSKSYLLRINGGMVIYSVITALFLFIFFLNQIVDLQRPIELCNFSKLVYLAKYTYGLYMYHRIAGFILSILIYKVMKLDHGMLMDFFFVVIDFCLAFLMAILSYNCIERPLIIIKNNYSFFRR